MVYLILLHLPLTEQVNLTKIIKYLQNKYESENVTVSETKTHYEISCRVSPSNLSEVLEKLESMGVGVRYGVLDVISLVTSVPNVKGAKSKNRFASSGLPLRMIQSTVSSGSGLSVDYCLYIIVAAALAGIGLATDNPVTIVASMLVSPLMVPLSGLCFGILMFDWMLILKSLISEAVGILLCLIMGIFVAFLTVPMVGDQKSFTSQFRWPGDQMIGRGTPEALFTGLFVAIPSGVGVPLSLVAGNVSSLVGVAISAALLPPIVCCGMNLVYGSLGPFLNSGITRDEATKGLEIAGYSLALFVENSIVIILCSIIVLKLKNVKPLRKASRWYKSLPTVPPPGLSLIPRSFTLYHLNQHAKNRDTTSDVNLEELKAQSVSEVNPEDIKRESPEPEESILDQVPYIETTFHDDTLEEEEHQKHMSVHEDDALLEHDASQDGVELSPIATLPAQNGDHSRMDENASNAI
uniref:DUF389 domain-containing protein n=1 Tax=Percolomonas cosmopolitus TaxID=63605 RepID=A0A7S1KTP6_9EUKA|mmetsp:Transcript_8627/g.31883  ORF Transcript_8627/g.31883 Transcript_8627/m.31883 type:complete len:466 (+) Transcript_8627:232-1629(+)|eukprot:CAMPEP_0117450388 /NCGR_PEP_ID=MMETSP0759-20121206/8442_1 /TAXON_ID=63605 /ORGANISM="Percolomonas cosmopolitus, Strain WS" /LENGTH=465 /DNA_ID=CAMNT_0005242907 /DNA_START=13 /DNA_END=1410 /DNA_ORIENTATION=+